jgi:hypothetical protein
MPDCGPNIKDTKGGENLSDKDVNEMVASIRRLAEQRAKKIGGNIDEALKQIEGELVAGEQMMNQIEKRNILLGIQTKRKAKEFASRFPTLGEGITALNEGSNRKVKGARDSVDSNGRAIHGMYFGKLIERLESNNVLGEFRRNELEHEVWLEMGEIGKGERGRILNPTARKIAEAIESTTSEMVAHQNRAGSYITKIPGYIARQTHDQTSIRMAGGDGSKMPTRGESFKAWSEFVRPLLDEERTFLGANPQQFLHNVHEGLYTGVHGPDRGEAETAGIMAVSPLAKKLSQSRVLHFKDAESAFQYNQAFGVKNLKDAVFSDVFYRARGIALMEKWGPNPEANFKQTVRELLDEARLRPDAAKQVDSLRHWSLEGSFNTVSGKNDVPSNFTFNRAMKTIRSVVQLSTMGSTLLSSLSDKAFLQSEMGFQGVSGLQTLGAQISGMFSRSPEGKSMLHSMGVALDGLIGNTISRFTLHNTTSGWAHRAQQKLFDLNFMNWWTDVNKATVAEVMSNHLAEHSHLPMEKLPGELSHVLSLYNITPMEWDALRNTAWTRSDNNTRYITPDKASEVSPETLSSIAEEQGLKPTPANLLRVQKNMENKLRAYFTDRVDIAVPTPGAKERRFAQLNTQAGTPLGEAMRTVMLFKSFPMTVMNKVLGREVYGRGNDTIGQFLMNDHTGKFRVAQLIAMATAMGYLGGVIRDTLKGRTPKELVTDGKVNLDVFNDAMLKGGGMGIAGDFLFSEYDQRLRTPLGMAAGPVLGQLDSILELKSKITRGEDITNDAEKLLLGNTPYINLFYIRPVLDYFVLWNLHEMMSPGSLERMEHQVETKNHQGFFMRPSERARK